MLFACTSPTRPPREWTSCTNPIPPSFTATWRATTFSWTTNGMPEFQISESPSSRTWKKETPRSKEERIHWEQSTGPPLKSSRARSTPRPVTVRFRYFMNNLLMAFRLFIWNCFVGVIPPPDPLRRTRAHDRRRWGHQQPSPYHQHRHRPRSPRYDLQKQRKMN